MKELIYQDKNRKQRVDAYLKDCLGIQRERIKELLKSQKILVNRQKANPSYYLRHKDRIEIDETFASSSDISVSPQKGCLDILYEDAHIIAVNKQSGVLTHPTARVFKDTLVNYLLNHTELAPGCAVRPGVVHRLDRETSGVIIFAKTGSALSNLMRQFKNREVNKEYIALVKGRFFPLSREIEFTVHPDKKNKTTMEVRYLRGKKTVTRVDVIKYIQPEDITLVSAKPITGRTHQIRLALSSVGYPIIGDGKYGVKSNLIDRVALHAYRIGFRHPSTGEKLNFTAPVPADISEIIKYYSPL